MAESMYHSECNDIHYT